MSQIRPRAAKLINNTKKKKAVSNLNNLFCKVGHVLPSLKEGSSTHLLRKLFILHTSCPTLRHYSIKKRKPGPLMWSFGFWVLTFTGCQQFKVVWWVIMGLFIMKIVQISRGELSREINCRTEACIVARQPLFCLVFGFSAQLLLLKCSQGNRAPYFILIASMKAQKLTLSLSSTLEKFSIF